MPNRQSTDFSKRCGGVIALCVFVVLLGCLFQYSLWSLVGKDVPFWLDLMAGFFLRKPKAGRWIVLSALCCLVASHCGCPAPFLGFLLR